MKSTLYHLALLSVAILLGGCTLANGPAQPGNAAPTIHLFGESRVTVSYQGEATPSGPGKSFTVESVGGTLAKAAANMEGEYRNKAQSPDGTAQEMSITIKVKSGSGFGDLFTFAAGAVTHMFTGSAK